MLSEIKLDFSGVICVDGGQVIAFFYPFVVSDTIESFLSNCFLVMDKRSRPEKIRMLLVEGVMNKLCPVYTFSSRDIQIITLLVTGKSYEFISSVFSLSFTSIWHARNKIVHQGRFRNMNVFRVVMVRLKNGLARKQLSSSMCSSVSVLSPRGGLYA